MGHFQVICSKCGTVMTQCRYMGASFMKETTYDVCENCKEKKCPKEGCNNEPDDLGICPFDAEVYDNPSLCSCCKDCRQKCTGWGNVLDVRL